MIADLTLSFICARQADGRAPRTIADYRRCLTPFADWCARGSIKLPGLNRDVVRRYVATLYAGPWSPGTIGIHVRNLRAFLRWLYEEEQTPENLARAVKAPKSAIRLEDLPADAEIVSLLAACQGDKLALRDRALILAMLDTGLRSGELVTIHRAHLHLDDAHHTIWFRVLASKTDTCHFAFLGLSATRAILDYLAARRDAYPDLWVGVRGPLTTTGIYKAVRRRALQAGLDPSRVHPHAFRKLFATHWTQNGGDRTRLKRLGGWKSDEIVDRYVLLAERTQLAAGHRRYGPADRLFNP